MTVTEVAITALAMRTATVGKVPCATTNVEAMVTAVAQASGAIVSWRVQQQRRLWQRREKYGPTLRRMYGRAAGARAGVGVESGAGAALMRAHGNGLPPAWVRRQGWRWRCSLAPPARARDNQTLTTRRRQLLPLALDAGPLPPSPAANPERPPQSPGLIRMLAAVKRRSRPRGPKRCSARPFTR